MGACDTVNNNANQVYNCTRTLLGTSHTQAAYREVSDGIASAPQTRPQIRQVGDALMATDSSTALYIHDLSGRSYAAGSALPHGLYIVRAVKDGVSTSFRWLR